MRHPDVPESLEGWWILHRMFGFDRRRWMEHPAPDKSDAATEFVAALLDLKERQDADAGIAALVGHKADLMLTHYGRSFEAIAQAQVKVDACALIDFLEPRDSYVSVLELGLYEATAKIHEALRHKELTPFSPQWNDAFDAMLREQAEHPRNAERLWARIPQRRYVCFYPMDKKRGESVNWYLLPYAERARLMLDHGKIGRTFHGRMTQVISGSVGYDDYEWGVDLYADDPLVFKKLIYEMRFDEASARYAEFGPFFSGMQFSIGGFSAFLDGEIPALRESEPAAV